MCVCAYVYLGTECMCLHMSAYVGIYVLVWGYLCVCPAPHPQTECGYHWVVDLWVILLSLDFILFKCSIVSMHPFFVLFLETERESGCVRTCERGRWGREG